MEEVKEIECMEANAFKNLSTKEPLHVPFESIAEEDNLLLNEKKKKSKIGERAIIVSLSLIILIILGTALDLYFYFRHLKTPQINTIEVSLQSSNGIDADVTIHGQAQKSSYTTKFDVIGGYCEYFYQENSNTNFISGGKLNFIFPQDDSNAENNYGLSIQLENSNYDILRKIYHDLSARILTTDSAMKISCSLDITALVYMT